MNEIEKIKDLMLRMGEYLPKTQYIRESKEFLSEAHENIDMLLATRYKNIDKDTAMQLLLFDPTYQKGPLVKGEYPNPSKKAGNYGVWILDRYLNGEITLNDGDKVYKTLNVFKNIGNNLSKSNINAYSSFQELYDEVLPFINGEKNMDTHSEMVDKYRHIPDTEIPYEDDFWLVVTPFNEEASCQVGGGTKWCTASRESVNYFWRYAMHVPLFVIISKSENGVKYQYNTWSDEFKDVQNEKANMDSVGLSPKLLEWIKNGADEYKEKYLQEIKPYKKQYFQQINQRLANRENPEDIFDFVGEFKNGFARVKLGEIGYNFLKKDGTLLWHDDIWFDECWNFKNGFAMVKIKGKGWNYLKTDGTLLWPDDTWFDMCCDFKNGYAAVGYKVEWCYLTQSGDLISVKQYIQQIKECLTNGEDPKKIFDYVGDFKNGFARVRIEEIGYNFIKTDGTLLWNGDIWFDEAWNFHNGFAEIYINGKGYNFIKSDNTLLWHGDTWFNWCYDFQNGFAKVGYDGNYYDIDTEGLLHKI